MGRARGRARLLDDDRGGADRRPSEDLRDAWERLRETAVEFGEQRIYASHHSIMFSRKSCYFFVRPKRKFLEVCIFLDRPIHDPRVRRVERPSRTKVANVIRVTHRDEVEAPFTDWLREAYALFDRPGLGLASPAPARRSNLAKKATGARKGGATEIECAENERSQDRQPQKRARKTTAEDQSQDQQRKGSRRKSTGRKSTAKRTAVKQSGGQLLREAQDQRRVQRDG